MSKFDFAAVLALQDILRANADLEIIHDPHLVDQREFMPTPAHQPDTKRNGYYGERYQVFHQTPSPPEARKTFPFARTSTVPHFRTTTTTSRGGLIE
ncbi:hypothetical protein [Asaia sp. HumB]|uniref:hypothetical protein n=1 Tax=Asaia sp. HumB TaxID=3035475 RepID=UPI0025568CE8|nr:hypothetical protein [Asaia sp. HumB]MDL2169573.1 hypothetical protein [Asaia sp. HumB]